MKLRNKKTGEKAIFTIIRHTSIGDDYLTTRAEMDDWEDYEPKEPLIKDEKIRKCAKLWLAINEIYSVTYHKQSTGGSYLELDPMPMRNGYCIMFNVYIDDLEDGATYATDELCGEEEE